jgi:hypothetical protein
MDTYNILFIFAPSFLYQLIPQAILMFLMFFNVLMFFHQYIVDLIEMVFEESRVVIIDEV